MGSTIISQLISHFPLCFRNSNKFLSNRIFTARLSQNSRRRNIIVHSRAAYNLKLVTPSTEKKVFPFVLQNFYFPPSVAFCADTTKFMAKTKVIEHHFLLWTSNFFPNFRLLIKYFRDEKMFAFVLFFAHEMSFIDQKEFMNEMSICDIVEKHKFVLMSSYFESSCHF